MFQLTEKDDVEYVDIPIFSAPPVRREVSKGINSVYFDITFLDNVASNHIPLHAIVFQNYYTSAVSLSQNTTDGNNPVTVLESKILMENPCCEREGNNWQIIHASELKSHFTDRKTIRVNLYQSSGIWNNYDIRNVKVVGTQTKKASKSSAIPPAHAITKVNTFLKLDMSILKGINA